jgi:hypothetical protein
MKTNPLSALRKLPVFLAMTSRGRMPTAPKPKVKGAKEVAAIIDKVRAMGG